MEEINYKKSVRESADKEFQAFQQALIEGDDTKKVFDAALEINTKREL